ISTRAFVFGLIVFQIAASVCWEYFKFVMDDPLYQFSPAPTMISYPLLGAALMFRRRSTIGQNVTMWATFTGMCVFWFPTAWLFYGPAAHSAQSIAAGVVAITGGAIMTYLISGKTPWFKRTSLPTDPAPPVLASVT
ncbi:hypothetical protein, partial [Mycobacterium sp.]|uniref:hypothetical protein n=1 Tax=Mycobacterium sp. TaxID=1785 RepID=UPI003BAE71DA